LPNLVFFLNYRCEESKRRIMGDKNFRLLEVHKE
jgi:hypothetical protein